MSQQLSPLEQNAGALVLRAHSFSDIQTPGQCAEARDALKQLAGLRAELNAARLTETQPHRKQAELINAKWNALIDPIDVTLDALKSAMSEYADRQAALAAESAARLSQMEQMAHTDLDRPTAPLVMDHVQHQNADIAMRTDYDLVVTDLSKISNKYFVLDDKLLKADLKAGVKVPGAELAVRKTVIAR